MLEYTKSIYLLMEICSYSNRHKAYKYLVFIINYKILILKNCSTVTVYCTLLVYLIAYIFLILYYLGIATYGLDIYPKNNDKIVIQMQY